MHQPGRDGRAAARTVEHFEKIDILVYATGTNTPDRWMTRLNTKVWDELSV